MVKVKVQEQEYNYYNTSDNTIYLSQSLFEPKFKKKEFEKAMKEEITHVLIGNDILNILWEFKDILIVIMLIIAVGYFLKVI